MPFSGFGMIENQKIVSGLIGLALIRSHVAAARVLAIGSRHATLISLQQMALSIGAATLIACVNRWASREQGHSLGWPAVIPQHAQLGVGVVPIAGVIEVARTIAAQVVPNRGHTAVAVAIHAARDDAVLHHDGTNVVKVVAFAPIPCPVPTDGAV